MLLGKRPRPPMMRTTSMRDVAVDLDEVEAVRLPAVQEVLAAVGGYQLQQQGKRMSCENGDLATDQRRNFAAVDATVSMRAPRWNFAAVETAPFLRVCALCQGRLHPDRDIFMYRGEIAFCSSECRQQQINQDERREKEKCSISSVKKDSAAAQVTSPASEASNAGGTVVAA